jgi:hypothetical protein
MHIPTGGKNGFVDPWTPVDVTKLRLGELHESTVVIVPGGRWNIAAC